MGLRDHRTVYTALLCLVFLAGAFLRICDLGRRPMHTDEAVHGIKFGALLERNYYRYDPVEYHGPLLNYVTLIPSLLSGADRLEDVHEATLRIVPAVFGIALLAGLLLLKKGMSRVTLLAAAAATALAPGLVFFSRYYIQEILLTAAAFGLIGCGYRYAVSRRWGWAAGAGICLGLMHASKETAVLSLGAMGLAFLAALLVRKDDGTGLPFQPGRLFFHLLAGLSAALGASVLFYSSFLTHPSGLIDSVLTYFNYAGKAASHEWHQHPWFFYFRLLIIDPVTGDITLREMPVLLLAAVGCIGVISGSGRDEEDKRLHRFIFFYTVFLAVIYSSLPYKTPWSMLGFYHGILLLAGIGAASLWRGVRSKAGKWAVGLCLSLAVFWYGLESYRLNFIHDTDPGNPWVYGHTSPDIPEMSRLVHDLAEAHPDGKGMYIEVISPEHDYWPLPWYFRDLPNTGWWTAVDTTRPAAPVIIAFPRFEQDILYKLYAVPPPGEAHLYLLLGREYTEIRPGVEIRGYVKKDVWDAFLRSGAENVR